jgi:hypothetical protein
MHCARQEKVADLFYTGPILGVHQLERVPAKDLPRTEPVSFRKASVAEADLAVLGDENARERVFNERAVVFPALPQQRLRLFALAQPHRQQAVGADDQPAAEEEQKPERERMKIVVESVQAE